MISDFFRTGLEHLNYPDLTELANKNNPYKKKCDLSNKKIDLYPDITTYKKAYSSPDKTNDLSNKKINLYPDITPYKNIYFSADKKTVSYPNAVDLTSKTTVLQPDLAYSANKRTILQPEAAYSASKSTVLQPEAAYSASKSTVLEPEATDVASKKTILQPDRSNKPSFIPKSSKLENRKITPLGFTNRGLYCWLNSSLKLLLETIDINDIINLANKISASSRPDSSINLVRMQFIKLWKHYTSFSGVNRDANLIILSQLKDRFITSLQKFVYSGNIDSDGLKDYFLTSNPNKRQDTNLFLMSMERILLIQNEQHSLKVTTYIDATYNKNNINKYIIRRSSCNPALIINISGHQQFNSINEYIHKTQKIESNVYHWSKDELLRNNIQIVSNNDTPLRGNKFEVVEANFAELKSFIVYFSLESIEASKLNEAHYRIVNMLLTDDFPRDYIDVRNSKNIKDKRRLNITAKAMVCFSGYAQGVHYICLTIHDNELIKHDDVSVSAMKFKTPQYRSLSHEKKCMKYLTDSVLEQHKLTPYAILYNVD